MATGTIKVDMAMNHVAVLTLDRPPVNALDRATREAFVEEMDRLGAREDVRAIVLTGSGKVFCAGADIKEKRDLAEKDGDFARANRLTRDTFLALIECPKPVIAAVNGAAIGAGFVMAACSDIIVAAESATFAMPEIDVGQGGGGSFLQRILPSGKVRRLTLTGERIAAAELYRLGAIEECVPADALLPKALDIAALIAEKSPAAIKAIRGGFHVVEHLGLYEGFRLEQEYTTKLSRTSDAAEARRAFLEKRKPRFE